MNNCSEDNGIYNDLATESEDPGVTQIDSLCMNCYEQGSTKLLLTKIPHFKEVIISSFECEHCGEKNNGIQSSNFQDLGIRYTLQVEKIDDLSRQIVRSDSAKLLIPKLEFEIPAEKGKGEITTLEGFITKAINGLNQDQERRKILDNKLFDQIENFISKLKDLLEVKEPFTFILDDPSGNSFIENPNAPKEDEYLSLSKYKRTSDQNYLLGISDDTFDNRNEVSTSENTEEFKSHNEVLQFNTICDHCSKPSTTKMKLTEIPHFKTNCICCQVPYYSVTYNKILKSAVKLKDLEVIIMATECDHCGTRTNEVKSGSGIEKLGKKYTLKIESSLDLARDVLKSETCDIIIPDLELNVGGAIFVGKFTTIEGLICDIQTDLKKNPFLLGDSALADTKQKIEKIIQDLQEVVESKKSITLILNDPAGNSYIQDIYMPDRDPRLTVENYERTYEQNDELGLNEMVTENYATEENITEISE